jgi:hypothetical protein
MSGSFTYDVKITRTRSIEEETIVSFSSKEEKTVKEVEEIAEDLGDLLPDEKWEETDIYIDYEKFTYEGGSSIPLANPELPELNENESDDS